MVITVGDNKISISGGGLDIKDKFGNEIKTSGSGVSIKGKQGTLTIS